MHLRIASLGLNLMHITLSDNDPLAASLVLKAKSRVVKEFEGG